MSIHTHLACTCVARESLTRMAVKGFFVILGRETSYIYIHLISHHLPTPTVIFYQKKNSNCDFQAFLNFDYLPLGNSTITFYKLSNIPKLWCCMINPDLINTFWNFNLHYICKVKKAEVLWVFDLFIILYNMISALRVLTRHFGPI